MNESRISRLAASGRTRPSVVKRAEHGVVAGRWRPLATLLHPWTKEGETLLHPLWRRWRAREGEQLLPTGLDTASCGRSLSRDTGAMVRTGARAAALSILLSDAGTAVDTSEPRPPRMCDLNEGLAEDVLALYRSFGGSEAAPTLRPGGWDLVLEDGVLLELDEELHFNRYRRETLKCEWARHLSWCDPYIRLCQEKESDCLRAGSWGRRWTNTSREATFGPADLPGTFASNGAPRWKQRALYDAMKDAYALSGHQYRVARVSVHDPISGVTLGEAPRGLGSRAPARSRSRKPPNSRVTESRLPGGSHPRAEARFGGGH